MTSHEDLRNHSESGLQVQQETEMLTRRLIVARTALEMISNGECAPEISKTARAALDSLDTLDGLDELKVFYRKMSAGEYEHFLAERKMAIARSALETIANGKTDPGVRKLARETQDGFSVLSNGEKVKGFFAGVQQDQPIPEVDPADLKRFHENTIERSREAGPGVAIGLSALGLGQSISGEDAGPLCVRNWVIGKMRLCRDFWVTGNRAQSWMAPFSGSRPLFQLTEFNSILKRL